MIFLNVCEYVAFYLLIAFHLLIYKEGIETPPHDLALSTIAWEVMLVNALLSNFSSSRATQYGHEHYIKIFQKLVMRFAMIPQQW